MLEYESVRIPTIMGISVVEYITPTVTIATEQY